MESIEEKITKMLELENLLKKQKNWLSIFYDIENLMITTSNQEIINALKNSTSNLMGIKKTLPPQQQEYWESVLTKQIRCSVDIIKDKKALSKKT